MLGKTHTAVGVAAAIWLVQPQTLPELVLGVSAASAGAVISDIDVDSHKKIAAVCTAIAVAAFTVVGVDICFSLGIVSRLRQNTGLYRMIIGMICFAGICLFGKEQPHRSFMHSILAWVLLCASLQMAAPVLVPYFAVAFLSHVLLDLLNKKKVRLLYPMKQGFCIGVCTAKGSVNTILGLLGTIAALIGIARIILHWF